MSLASQTSKPDKQARQASQTSKPNNKPINCHTACKGNWQSHTAKACQEETIQISKSVVIFDWLYLQCQTLSLQACSIDYDPPSQHSILESGKTQRNPSHSMTLNPSYSLHEICFSLLRWLAFNAAYQQVHYDRASGIDSH